MTQFQRLDAALARFQEALDSVEAAGREKRESRLSLFDLEEELAVMLDDRSRLALDLDAALARAAMLEKTREEILRRLERASENVAAVLGDEAKREDQEP
jgi:hypothetical protein